MKHKVQKISKYSARSLEIFIAAYFLMIRYHLTEIIFQYIQTFYLTFNDYILIFKLTFILPF